MVDLVEGPVEGREHLIEYMEHCSAMVLALNIRGLTYFRYLPRC